MAVLTDLPRYEIDKSYQWNYDHAPDPVQVDVPEVPGSWDYFGRKVASPLGIAAGPLLNGKWILYYASLGFDVLNYKTVRTAQRDCYDLPNLQPVETGALSSGGSDLPALDAMAGNWAISFGMPSQEPSVWQQDIQKTRDALAADKALSVSVVGTMQQGWGIEELAADYAEAARLASGCGADAIEINFSCPNVSTTDGQLYQHCASAGLVAAAVRQAIGPKMPLLVKIGQTANREAAAALIDALLPNVCGISMINSIPAKVHTNDGEHLFGGAQRGIGGPAITQAATQQVAEFKAICEEKGAKLGLVGVGGVSTYEDVKGFLDAGACSVHLATGAMVNPAAALEIRKHMAAGN